MPGLSDYRSCRPSLPQRWTTRCIEFSSMNKKKKNSQRPYILKTVEFIKQVHDFTNQVLKIDELKWWVRGSVTCFNVKTLQAGNLCYFSHYILTPLAPLLCLCIEEDQPAAIL